MGGVLRGEPVAQAADGAGRGRGGVGGLLRVMATGGAGSVSGIGDGKLRSVPASVLSGLATS